MKKKETRGRPRSTDPLILIGTIRLRKSAVARLEKFLSKKPREYRRSHFVQEAVMARLDSEGA